jgi:hypothetical protein
MFQAILNSKLRNALLAVGALAGVAVAPSSALAHHHGFFVDVAVPVPQVVVPAPVVVSTPQCDTPGQVWIPAQYQTVTERVWVPAVTTTQVQRVEVPAQYGYRDVVVYDIFGHRHFRREQFEISPAHCEDQAVQVVVTPAHYEDQTHQQLVCEGHWAVQQPVTVVQPAGARIEIPLPF